MQYYDKLVRDGIPVKIESKGGRCEHRMATDAEYPGYAKRKLLEEFGEYGQSETDAESLEELVDLLEIIYALAEVHGSDEAGLENLRQQKRAKVGAYRNRVILVKATPR